DYPVPDGAPSFKEHVASWASERHGLSCTSQNVVAVHGAKLAVANAVDAFSAPGDVVVVPTPGYPTYQNMVSERGRSLRWLTLREETGWLPSIDELRTAFRGAKMAYLNYPMNPTGAVANETLLSQVVEVARETGTTIVHDAAYLELAHQHTAPSILAQPGGWDVAIEVHSLSKAFHLCGWRVGFVLGAGDKLAEIRRVLGLVDTGPSRASQLMAEVAMSTASDFPEGRRARDAERTGYMARILSELGCHVTAPGATFYLWFRPPEGKDGWDEIVKRAGVACAPGEAFGPAGKGWVRFSCIQPITTYDEVGRRLAALWK
ncbi:MAG: pyridoxal phosphate-dependent aminotransferase, partial [Myxococcales bacterium]|nr:pyridoxal phosphate-dependent aminotransferase [Myxococcales bacterium]